MIDLCHYAQASRRIALGGVTSRPDTAPTEDTGDVAVAAHVGELAPAAGMPG
jgi:hypothetical protein